MPELKESKWIWMNGKFVPWKKAKIHILSHVIHYGTAAFEGIRCYKLKTGRRAIFRLREHIKRLFESAKIYHMEETPYFDNAITIPFSQNEIVDAVSATVKKNNLDDAYIRPVIYRGFKEIGVNSLNCPIEIAIAAMPFGKYLGPEALEKGIEIMVSSHRRYNFPALGKDSGHYLNSQLIKIEAIKNGYQEGVALDQNGHVSECSGENIFILKDKKLYTPSIGNYILPGITRDSIIAITRQILGLEVIETSIPREMLILADEVFITGTWAEITPVCAISKQLIGNGKAGEITRAIQTEYTKITMGENESFSHWFHFID